MDRVESVALEITGDEPNVDESGRFNTHTANVVDFDSVDDLANPVNWSLTYKWTIVVLISVMSLVV